MPKVSRYVQGRLDERKANYEAVHEMIADIRNKLGPFWSLVEILGWTDKSVGQQFDVDEQVRLCKEKMPIITKQLQNILDKLD